MNSSFHFKYVPILEGEYCPRTTETCAGDGCEDYKGDGCEIYRRSALKLQSLINIPQAV